MTDGPAPGVEALARHDWSAAYDEIAAVADVDRDAAALDRLAEATWWLSRMDECVAAREGAYHAFREAGDDRRSAQSAVWLFEHNCFLGRPSIAGAWLRRARHAIGDDHECVEFGNLLLREAELLHSSGDLARAASLAHDAIALGRRLGSAELEALGLQTAGRLEIDRGSPAEGLRLLDEAMLFAIEGRLSPYATGKTYCSLISACDELGDLARAEEWTAATTTWAEQHPFAVFPGLCRVHRAQILGWRGQWEAAVVEAQRACDELEPVHVGNASVAWAEIGDIRRRLGDLDGAEEAFERATALAGRPPAALALLRLAQGRIEVARAEATRALDDQGDHQLGRAKVLPALVQIAVAAGDTDAAVAACAELTAIAARFETPTLEASALTSQGRVSLATGACAEARRVLVLAAERWQALDVPYEVATAQLLLGQSCRSVGDEERASVALASAVATFDELGARLDAQRTRRLHDDGRTTWPGGLTRREVEVLALVADGRTNKEIADELTLSVKTVARHLENTFVKLGVTNRASATAFAIANGLTLDRTD